MKKIVAVGIATVFLSIFLVGIASYSEALAQGQDLIESIGGNGKVNWSSGYVEAVGIGAPPESAYGKPTARPMALRAARVDAYRNLLEIVKGVRVDSTTEVKDFTVSSDTIRAQVEGLVKGAQVIKQDYMSDGTVEVTLRMSLNGDFAQAILPTPKVLKSDKFDKPAGPLAPQAPVAAPSTPSVGDARRIHWTCYRCSRDPGEASNVSAHR